MQASTYLFTNNNANYKHSAIESHSYREQSMMSSLPLLVCGIHPSQTSDVVSVCDYKDSIVDLRCLGY